MRKRGVRLAAAATAVLSACGIAQAGSAGRDTRAAEEYAVPLAYELVWADEFDTDGPPDPALWDYDTGGDGWGNHELEYYTPGDNACVRDGVLVIELRKETKGGNGYTSSRLVSRGKGDWLYCKAEVRASLPVGVGTWPAVWMLPTDWQYGPWPRSGEIDIMEHVGYDPDVIVQSVHTSRNHGGGAMSARKQVPGACGEFHVYGMEWLPDRIIFSVDGETTFIYQPDDSAVLRPEEVWPFDRRMHLLINLAFGGDWGGVMGIDEGCLPARLTVDYVRIYQSPEVKGNAGM